MEYDLIFFSIAETEMLFFHQKSVLTLYKYPYIFITLFNLMN